MEETFKKLTNEIKSLLEANLATQGVKDALEKTKGAQDSGNFEVVISTADIDRQGESIDQNGWQLDYYNQNPIVLWAHDYSALPIAVTDEIKMENGQLVAKGRFAPEEANPFAQQVRRLYDLKIVRATSVGFIAKESNGKIISKAELLEFSFVPVPANPFALSLSKAQQLGFDIPMLQMKGVEFKADPKEGDMCTMDDGSEGMMAPDANGNMVCMSKPAEKVETTDNYVRIPVKDAANYDQDSIRTIDISKDEGIKALSACPKGKFSNGTCSVGVEIITYLFDSTKWTEKTAQDWVDQHKSEEFNPADTEKNPPPADDDQQADEALLAAVGQILDKSKEDVLAAITAEDTNEPAQNMQKGQKVGRVLSEKTKTAITKAIDASKACTAALEELLIAVEPQSGKGEERQNGGALKQRSGSAGSNVEVLEAWLHSQQVLRAVNNATAHALEKFNKKTGCKK